MTQTQKQQENKTKTNINWNTQTQEPIYWCEFCQSFPTRIKNKKCLSCGTKYKELKK